MKNNLILEVKKKKEFSKLPDSLIERALLLNKNEIKGTRAYLRKYFGVFLTNKVLKPKDLSNWEEVLSKHISSKNRDYNIFYKEIVKKSPSSNFENIIDLGAGMNGFSLPSLRKNFNFKKYIGIESIGQFVDLMNRFFREELNEKDARAIWLDLFDLDSLEKLISEFNSPKIFFLFQLLDSLENFERNFSKKLLNLILNLMSKEDFIIVSFSMRSLSGKEKINAKRTWFLKFINENFFLEDDFILGDERIFIVRKN